MSAPLKKNEVKLLDHEYDGIREFDQRLPNWWLVTLYGAIIFAVGYWFFYQQTDPSNNNITRLKENMAEVDQARLEAELKMLDDTMLWTQVQDDAFVAAGRDTYMQTCVACHSADLTGGIGFNLVDNEWVHGGKPTEIFMTISKGVDGKAMQAWEANLGSFKIAQVVAFILSHHEMPEDFGAPVGSIHTPPKP